MYPKVFLKVNKEKPVKLRHPWIFSGAIAKADTAKDGETVDIISSSGQFLARGYYNSHSQIVVRIWTWKDETIDESFYRKRVQRAIESRLQLGFDFKNPQGKTTAFRLINAESDLLPGLIVDVYSEFLVAQSLTRGIDEHKKEIVEILYETLSPRGIFERSDIAVREKEGLKQTKGVLSGEKPPTPIEIRENGLSFLVDLEKGHKTGFYLDQRENRQELASILTSTARAKRDSKEFSILNAFSYSGAFGIYACSVIPHAKVVNLDDSNEALELAKENFSLNQMADRAEYLQGDAFQLLRKFRDEGRAFDCIILDPPKFAYSQNQVMSACRGYKDLNLLGFKLLRPGGVLVTFSCSGAVSHELFQKVVFEAALDAEKSAQVVRKLGQASDHPFLLSFPDGEYLKGLIVRVADEA